MTGPSGPDTELRTELRTELIVIDDVGPPRRSRARRAPGPAWFWLLPALALIAVVIVWPAGMTVRASLLSPDGTPLGNYGRALGDPQMWTTLRNTVVWAVAVPVLVTLLGYGLAVLTRRMRLVLVRSLMLAPMAVPLIVTAVAFRLVYAPSPELGPATALIDRVAALFGVPAAEVPPLLGSGLILVAVVSAFVWAWVGLAAVMFRDAIDAVPTEIEDAARAEGADSWRVLIDVRWPFLRRVAGVLVLLLAVAASRTFDLVLVMAPGSVQDEAEVLSLYVLRQAAVQQAGEAAAVSVLWLLVVVLGALLTARWARHEWPWPAGARARTAPAPPTVRRLGGAGPVARRIRSAVVGAALLVFLFPLVMLAVIALRDPVGPAVDGWLAAPSLRSLAGLGDSGLLDALLPTAVVALAAAVCVVGLATLAAYAVAWFDLPGERVLIVLLLVAAVVPVQAIAGPLQQVLSPVRPYGAMLVLGIVHVALGLPFAMLVLRNAFSGVSADAVRAARLRHSGLGVLVRTIIPATWRSLVAVGVVEFVLVWNDFVVAFLFGGQSFSPVGLVLFGQTRQFVTSAGTLAAGALVMTLVPMVVLLGAQRALVTGLVPGTGRRR